MPRAGVHRAAEMQLAVAGWKLPAACCYGAHTVRCGYETHPYQEWQCLVVEVEAAANSCDAALVNTNSANNIMNVNDTERRYQSSSLVLMRYQMNEHVASGYQLVPWYLIAFTIALVGVAPGKSVQCTLNALFCTRESETCHGRIHLRPGVEIGACMTS